MKQLPTLYDVVGLPNDWEARCHGCGHNFHLDQICFVKHVDWYSESRRPFCGPCLLQIVDIQQRERRINANSITG